MSTPVPLVDLKAQYAAIREEITAAVTRVIESAYFVGGPEVEAFEREFAAYLGAQFAIGMGSGTAALELALKVAGVSAGDEVIVPANSFFASAEAVSNAGARPVFVDVDPRTFHMDVSRVRAAITSRTRAVIPVHLYGRAMDLSGLERIAADHKLVIIEDAAQAHGAQIRGTRVGAAGRLTCFSFYPGKNLGAYGDAGAVTTSDPEQARMLRLLRDHGSPSKYQHDVVGTNARLDAMQAAVLRVKLRQLDRWNELRRRHARTYAAALAGSKIVAPEVPAGGEHIFHLFVVRCSRRAELQRFLRERGIATGIHYPVPLHLTGAYQSLGYPGRGSFPVTELIADEILSLPMYPELTAQQLDHTIAALHEFAGQPGLEMPAELESATAGAR
jgi:dTDP-4-amino-4,6-dideoxygalactose transaminase